MEQEDTQEPSVINHTTSAFVAVPKVHHVKMGQSKSVHPEVSPEEPVEETQDEEPSVFSLPKMGIMAKIGIH